MKAINILAKISKQNLDASILEKKNISLNIALVRKDIQTLEDQMKTEINMFFGTEFYAQLENYLNDAKAKRHGMLYRIEMLQKQLAKEEEKISQFFEDLKRYEKIRENMQKQKLAKEIKKENEAMQDITKLKFYN
ncbi:MAG: hypothetical protein SFT91_04585 [Rickettsiaceae bacterium]|nr:hypothetical protein [Rickettsiaceae bacterium]